jgi:Domain of unknown function (DUF4209)
MNDKVTTSPTTEAVLQRFDAMTDPFTEYDVSQELNAAWSTLAGATEPERLAAWSEVLAFALAPPPHENPWKSYFGPMGSGISNDGHKVYSPDIAGTPKQVVDHWSHRAGALSHPLLKARYADLAWDMAQSIGQKKRDPDHARVAIDAYIASISARDQPIDRFKAIIRALDLASLISDAARVTKAREALMDLHREAIKSGTPLWWFAVDRLIGDKKVGLTDAELSELVADLESLVMRYTDQSSPGLHDPHSAQAAANRLITHYTKIHQPQEVKRLRQLVARAFEFAARLANAMLAAAFLQTAMDYYRDAGLPDESRRVRILLQEKIGEARGEMVPIEAEIEIPFDDMEKFLNSIITDDIGSSFVRIARAFLLDRKGLEEAIQNSAEESPLMAHLPFHIMAEDFVSAKIGSVGDDLFGRLFHEAKFRFSTSGIWLRETFARLLEKHEIHPEHFVGWTNRCGLFEDMALLLEGVRAWSQGDFVKANHVLIPQIEVALRSVANEAGFPVTKAHPKVAGTSVAIGMGDILYAPKVVDLLGPDITLHLQALFADPRGLNLRNEMAHGLLGASAFDGHIARLLIHCLLVLGIWEELARKR